MILRTVFALLGVLGLELGLAAAPALAEDGSSFDDPGMHFAAPAGWKRVDVGPPPGPSDAPEGGPVAAFVYHQGQPDQRAITIEIKPAGGDNLQTMESHHETELRSGQDSTYIEKREKTTLSNGMPAFYLRIGSGADAGHFMRRYQYVVYDGKRSIVVTYAGRQGDFSDNDAQTALATLYVVAYPRPHA